MKGERGVHPNRPRKDKFGSTNETHVGLKLRARYALQRGKNWRARAPRARFQRGARCSAQNFNARALRASARRARYALQRARSHP